MSSMSRCNYGFSIALFACTLPVLSQDSNIVSLATGNRWIYSVHQAWNYAGYSTGEEDYTVVKEVSGDSALNFARWKAIRVTEIHDSTINSYFEAWYADSQQFRISGYGPETRYDADVLEDSTWGHYFGVMLQTDTLWGQQYPAQKWWYWADIMGFIGQHHTIVLKGFGVSEEFEFHADTAPPAASGFDSIQTEWDIFGAHLEGTDFGGPAPPMNVQAVPDTNKVLISWGVNGESDLAYYNLYMGAHPDSLVLSASTTSGEDTMIVLDSLEQGTEYHFKVSAVDEENLESGTSVRVSATTLGDPLGIEAIAGNIPGALQLHQNYPNPFNGSTTIRFRVRGDGKFTLHVYNLLGERVATLINGQRTAGYHTAAFRGAGVPTGIYFYQLLDEKGLGETKKMLLVK